MDPEWDSRHYLFHSRFSFLPFCQPGRNWQVSIDPKLKLYLALRKAGCQCHDFFPRKKAPPQIATKLQIVSRHHCRDNAELKGDWRKLHVNKTNITRSLGVYWKSTLPGSSGCDPLRGVLFYLFKGENVKTWPPFGGSGWVTDGSWIKGIFRDLGDAHVFLHSIHLGKFHPQPCPAE